MPKNPIIAVRRIFFLLLLASPPSSPPTPANSSWSISWLVPLPHHLLPRTAPSRSPTALRRQPLRQVLLFPSCSSDRLSQSPPALDRPQVRSSSSSSPHPAPAIDPLSQSPPGLSRKPSPDSSCGGQEWGDEHEWRQRQQRAPAPAPAPASVKFLEAAFCFLIFDAAIMAGVRSSH
ncbi:lysine-rich arabinogalactan protein 19-like [Malania oleifera]|uniref:lysine-rich arabinogalactan protein 19-like n=1 Tax=Malania oleifera TaxID=397392 RepID=UPI0025AE4330|nr:lysine-rich arabinogalactan protein 19-like [Malania oleifera]